MTMIITDALLEASEIHANRTLSGPEREFIRDYYHRLPRDDFSEQATEELISSALRHRKLANTRKPGEVRVDLYSLAACKPESGSCTVLSLVMDDMPFLVDTLAILLTQQNLRIHRTIHPLFWVKRNKSNQITSIVRYRADDERRASNQLGESFIQIHFDATTGQQRTALKKAVRYAIREVQAVVADWTAIRGKLLFQAVEIENYPGTQGATSQSQWGQLLRWFEDHHFALLGYCEFDLDGPEQQPKIQADLSTALGFLRVLAEQGDAPIHDLLPPLACGDDKPFIITKSKQRSGIHRSAFMDCIILRQASPPNETQRNKQPNKQRVVCFLGLFTAASFVKPTKEIPLLRQKTEWILQQSTLRESSYAHKALRVILETLPRELLFQLGREKLFETSMEILNHQERRKTSVYIHQDQCGHFYSCLVYVPRDLFHSDLRIKIQQFLAEVLDADEVLFDVHFPDSILMRIHFIVHTRDGVPVTYDTASIEQVIRVMARDWNDGLKVRLGDRYGANQVEKLMERYADAFSTGYRDDFKISKAIIDIGEMEALKDHKIRSLFYLGDRDGKKLSRLKVYSHGESIPLSDILPTLENMGLRVLGERPYRIRRNSTDQVWIHDFELVGQQGNGLNIEADGDQLREILRRVRLGDADNDGFNQLALGTGLGWRQIMLLRACFKYLRQIRLRYSQEYVVDALTRNRSIAVLLCDLFEARFDPKRTDYSTESIEAEISDALEGVDSLDEDRILCALRDVIMAMLRCNYYQTDDLGEPKPYLSFKVDSLAIPRLPEPRPKYEVFVYSPRFEGIHLRGGEVARGGLRWSDRLEDYRTEVLGLVKAQMVKNAVIVPVGSKGGFVPKQLPIGDRDAVLQEAIACYQLFISGLLDLTDSISGEETLHPEQVVRHDGDDPYLVVAADKGTATFSDIANQISESRGFWLGDAFASGGSMGYDHKKMGITARGAWESVKRHFRELGKDIQTTPFTVLGIGDMSGDVFGNGMLLSKQTALVAAFNHLHIFIDPQPDPKISHAERKRLFEHPRSSWADYDHKLISKGGGVFKRSAKSIPLSPQIQKLVGSTLNRCSPNDLINHLLKMEVELLWNGGIGTYVKASDESHDEAQDKANDNLRVDANQLRCQVVGEGGNLGMTQKARIEFASLGGHCYTDAIDNSAGVDTSDHEVNLKILLNPMVSEEQMPLEQRNALLAEMETEVGELVLKNNYAQTQTVSVERHFAGQLMPQHVALIQALSALGMDRQVEFLPEDVALAERVEAGETLTAPELAVLLSYSKMALYDDLIASTLPDETALLSELEDYFPPVISERYPTQMRAHRLKREIISTHLTNRVIGQMGPAFPLRLASLTGRSSDCIARAWFTTQAILQSDELVAQIQALDNQIDASLQLQHLYSVTQMMEKASGWLLRNRPRVFDIDDAIDDLKPLLEKVLGKLVDYLQPEAQVSIQDASAKLVSAGLGQPLADQLARLSYALPALEIAGIDQKTKANLETTASTYFRVAAELDIAWLSQAIDALSSHNQWHERAQFALIADLAAHHAAITQHILDGDESVDQVADWLKTHSSDVTAYNSTIEQLKAQERPDFAMLSVLMSGLSQLV